MTEELSQNTLIDLNNHLFAELDRLSDGALEGDALDAEIKRAHAIKDVAQQVISNANVVLRAAEIDGMRIEGEGKVAQRLLGA